MSPGSAGYTLRKRSPSNESGTGASPGNVVPAQQAFGPLLQAVESGGMPPHSAPPEQADVQNLAARMASANLVADPANRTGPHNPAVGEGAGQSETLSRPKERVIHRGVPKYEELDSRMHALT